MSATLVLHCGATRVGREELQCFKAPPPTGTWFPVSHAKVLDTTVERLAALLRTPPLRPTAQHRPGGDLARQWQEPAFDWGGKTAWRLLNCMTYCLADVARRNPTEYANRTIRLNQLLSPFAGGPGGSA